jgi:hypothetical protein
MYSREVGPRKELGVDLSRGSSAEGGDPGFQGSKRYIHNVEPQKMRISSKLMLKPCLTDAHYALYLTRCQFFPTVVLMLSCRSCPFMTQLPPWKGVQ